MSSVESLVEAIVDLDEQAALGRVGEALEAGVDPVEILERCRQGMSIVGERFEKGEFFLSEMIMAAEIFTQIADSVRPQLKRSVTGNVGKIVIGTVEGDVHDIGKNIAIALLEAEGFEVVDLGVDVPPNKFVEAIKEHEPDIVGMSSLLTVAIESTKQTVDAITEAGLRDRVRIIVGGGRMDEHARDYVKPDAATDNAATGVRLCKQLLRGAEA
ncbi:MAG: cobalamin-dependent protein [Candidatus Bathyarchaeota archaeon]|nr:MAG: cobalamin-dependent protein [Candidatus Bathyarchaeota archaeon]